MGQPDNNKKILNFIVYASIFILASLVYLPSLFNEFVYDDSAFIVKNGYIQDIRYLKSIFNPKEYSEFFLEASYRPIATLSYMLLNFFFGLNPIFFRLFSILLHSTTVALLFLTIKNLLNNKKIAFFSSLFFLFFPAYSEAIFCVSYNEEIISAFFALLSFYLYIKDKKNNAVFSALSLFFALLAKEMAITIPFIILIYEFIFNYQTKTKLKDFLTKTASNRKEYIISYSIALFLYIILRFVIFKSNASITTDQNIFYRILFLPYNIFEFFKILVFPLNLKADYVFRYPKNFFELKNIIASLFSISLLFIIILLYKIKKEGTFAILWILVTLIPVLNIIPIYNPVAERYLYLPSIGFAILFGILLSLLDKIKFKNIRIILKIIFYTATFFLLLGFTFILITRSQEWHNNESLWNAELSKNPKSYRAHQGVALSLYEKGDYPNAIALFEKSIEITPDIVAYNNLGIIYSKLKVWDLAEKNFKKAVELFPNDPFNYYNLALLYKDTGKTEEELLMLNKIIELGDSNTKVYLNAGEIYEKRGELAKAESIYKKLLEKNNTIIAGYERLARVYLAQDKFNDALETLEKCASLYPNNSKIKEKIEEIKNKINANQKRK